mgnify:CR=1 FL=1
MKKLIFLIIITLFVLSCEDEKIDDLNYVSIDLITAEDPAFFTKTVILFESSDYLIKTNYDTYINAYPFDVLHGYDEIETKVSQDVNKHDVLLMSDYLSHPKDEKYILAHHLQKGSCLILDKKSNEIISIIEMDKYAVGEPMMSTGGRRFYIKGNLFLEVVDFIS